MRCYICNKVLTSGDDICSACAGISKAAAKSLTHDLTLEELEHKFWNQALESGYAKTSVTKRRR